MIQELLTHLVPVIRVTVLYFDFGPKGHEVTGGWEKLHNKEIHDLYSLPIIITISSQGRRDK
jgi:hypothetical protein